MRRGVIWLPARQRSERNGKPWKTIMIESANGLRRRAQTKREGTAMLWRLGAVVWLTEVGRVEGSKCLG